MYTNDIYVYISLHVCTQICFVYLRKVQPQVLPHTLEFFAVHALDRDKGERGGGKGGGDAELHTKNWSGRFGMDFLSLGTKIYDIWAGVCARACVRACVRACARVYMYPGSHTHMHRYTYIYPGSEKVDKKSGAVGINKFVEALSRQFYDMRCLGFLLSIN